MGVREGVRLACGLRAACCVLLAVLAACCLLLAACFAACCVLLAACGLLLACLLFCCLLLYLLEKRHTTQLERGERQRHLRALYTSQHFRLVHTAPSDLEHTQCTAVSGIEC